MFQVLLDWADRHEGEIARVINEAQGSDWSEGEEEEGGEEEEDGEDPVR